MDKASRFAPICFNEGDSFRDVMGKISLAGKFDLPSGLALMLSADAEVLGIVTDGDIRKALLKGAALDSTVDAYVRRNPVTIQEREIKQNAIAVISHKLDAAHRSSSRIEKLIVVDETNRLVDVIGFNEVVRMSDTRSQTVAVLGQGFVGLTLALAMANVGFNVTGVEKNVQVLEELNAGRPHFHESGIENTLRHCLGAGNYRCTSSLEDTSFNVLILAVNTPLGPQSMRTNLDDLRNACVELGPHIRKGHVVIQRSTAPVGTARELVKVLEETSGLEAGLDFQFAVAPERSIEGDALKEIFSIPQIIGGLDEASAEAAARILKPLVSSSVIVESMEAAELGKLICNGSRMVAFGFANQVALLADQYNIDAHKLIKDVNEGYPRNPISMPSPGVGGICLKKDPYILRESDRADLASSIVLEARKASDRMPGYVVGKIMSFKKQHYPNQPIKIFLLGFAFKGNPETSDVRDSSAWDIVELLARECKDCELYGFDPVVPPEDLSHPAVKFAGFENGWKGAHAAVILNNHQFFSKMDVYEAVSLAARPCLVFDTWDMLSHEGLLAEGVILQTLGSLRMSP